MTAFLRESSQCLPPQRGEASLYLQELFVTTVYCRFVRFISDRRENCSTQHTPACTLYEIYHIHSSSSSGDLPVNSSGLDSIHLRSGRWIGEFTAGFLFALLSGVLLSGASVSGSFLSLWLLGSENAELQRRHNSSGEDRTLGSGVYVGSAPGWRERKRRGERRQQSSFGGFRGFLWCGTCLPMLACGTQRYRNLQSLGTRSPGLRPGCGDSSAPPTPTSTIGLTMTGQKI